MSKLDQEDRNAIVSLWILAVLVIVAISLTAYFNTTARFDALEAQIEELHR